MSQTTLPQKGLRLTQALRSGAFAWFWMGQTISLLGDGAFRVALAVAVYQLTRSSLAMGLFLTAQILPELLFTLIGGVAADRLSRRLVLACSDVGRAMVVLVIAGLAWLSLLHLWHLFVLAVLFGFIQSFFGPAYRALVPELVVKEWYASANALTELGIQFGNLLGPVLGAGLIALGAGSASLAFAFDGLTFVIPVCSLLALRALAVDAGGQPGVGNKQPMGLRQMRQEVGEGFRTIFRSIWLRWSMLVATFGLVAYTGAMAVSLPKLVLGVYESGPWWLAAITAATGIGALVGTVFVGQVCLRRRGMMAFLAYILSGLALITFSFPLTRTLIPFCVVPAAFVVRIGMSVMQTIWLTLLYELVPNEKQGDMVPSYFGIKTR